MGPSRHLGPIFFLKGGIMWIDLMRQRRRSMKWEPILEPDQIREHKRLADAGKGWIMTKKMGDYFILQFKKATQQIKTQPYFNARVERLRRTSVSE